MDRKWRALATVAVAQLLVMSLWFSASAVAPERTARWTLSGTEAALLTSAVQVGFVVGAVISATLTLADTVPPRYLFAASALVGSALTFQTAVGFLLTTGSIQLTPAVAAVVGWQWAFAPLVVGPVVGTAAMLGLRASPAAAKLAGGNR